MSKIGGIGSSPDPWAAKELEEIKEEIAMNAVRSMQGNAPAQPSVQGPHRQGDRGAAQANLAAVPQVQMPSGDQQAIEAELHAKLAQMGLLPPPPARVTPDQFAQAMRQFIDQQRANPSSSEEINDIWFLLDKLMAEDNARRNKNPQTWSGNAPAQRHAGMPPASSYRAQGPAPNTGALQNQATQAINTNPPPPGSIQARVAEATRAYMGQSTAAGPDGGNLACAWSVNNILSNAGLQKVGSNPNYVPSVEQALNGGRGTRIDPSQAGPGDIVIWPNGHHIGVAMGNNQVANNSSSRAAFVNMQALPPGCRVYRLNS